MSTALIQERGTVSGNQMRMQRLPEAAGQIFLAGTPVSLVNGNVQALGAGATSLLGIAKDFAMNLPHAGTPLGLPANTAFRMPPEGGGQTFGRVQNQPLAKNLSRPLFNDGRTGVVLAIPDTVFYAQLGPAAAAPTAALVGQSGSLAMDTDNHWYVVVGTGNILKVVGLDQWDTQRGILITFLDTASQLPA